MKHRYHVVLVVWGEAYAQLYVDLVLPTNLSPGNLPALSAQASVTYHIHATSTAFAIIRDSPAFSELTSTVEVEFHPIDQQQVDTRKDAYALVTMCHQRSFEIARDRSEILIYLVPDAIFADGCFAQVHEHALAGYRAVMVVGPRALKQDFLADLRLQRPVAGESRITLDPRTLVRLLIDNFHPLERALCWREDELASYPSHLFWPVDRTGLIQRCYHLHPLMVCPQRWIWNAAGRDTLDTNLITQTIADLDKIHVVTDSDEIMVCELSDDSFGPRYDASPNYSSGTKRVAAWMHRETDALLRSYVKHKILIHSEDLTGPDEALWRSVERASDEVIDRIQREYEKRRVPPAQPAVAAP